MSEDKRKVLRTQGRFSDEFKKEKKSQEKVKKSSPKESDASSVKNQAAPRSYVDILKEKPVEYTENTPYSFNELSPKKEPIEIKRAGEKILGESTNGQSRIFYAPDFMEDQDAQSCFATLHDEIPWDKRNIIIRGKEFPQPRLVMWYGPYPYTYSGLTLEPAEMPESVIAIKANVEQYLASLGLDVTLNSVLLNLYRDCHDSIAWHSDDELSMGVKPTIASVSLGAVRRFLIRKKPDPLEISNTDKTEADYFVQLTNGSLLIMDGCMQKDWQHSVPKEYHDKDPRINLTFRTVYALDEEISKRDDRIRGSNKILTMKDFIREVPLAEATNRSTSHRSKREKDVSPDKSTKFDCPLEFPPLDDNKVNSTNKKAVVHNSVTKSLPEKHECLEIKQDNQDKSWSSSAKKEKSCPPSNRKRSPAVKSDGNKAKQDSQDKSMDTESVVEIASNADLKGTNCLLAEKRDNNETEQDSRDKSMQSCPLTDTASGATFHDSNHSLAEKSDSDKTKQDIQDKLMYADSLRGTASNATGNDRDHSVNNNHVDQVTQPNQGQPCPPFSNQSKLALETNLNVHANEFVPSFLPPGFPNVSKEKPNVSKEMERKPEATRGFVVPDSEQCSYTGNRQYNLSQDLLDLLDIPIKELIENTDFLVEEILRCLRFPLFSDRDKDELQFLCDISDGYQTPRNQERICERIRNVVLSAISAQNDSRSKMMRSSQVRQAGPPYRKSNMSPRHYNQRSEKRTDNMYKWQ